MSKSTCTPHRSLLAFGVTTWRPKYHLPFASTILNDKIHKIDFNWTATTMTAATHFSSAYASQSSDAHTHKHTRRTIKSANRIKVGKPLLGTNRDIGLEMAKLKKKEKVRIAQRNRRLSINKWCCCDSPYYLRCSCNSSESRMKCA